MPTLNEWQLCSVITKEISICSRPDYVLFAELFLDGLFKISAHEEKNKLQYDQQATQHITDKIAMIPVFISYLFHRYRRAWGALPLDLMPLSSEY